MISLYNRKVTERAFKLQKLRKILSTVLIVLSVGIPLCVIITGEKDKKIGTRAEIYVDSELIYNVHLPSQAEYVLNNGRNRILVDGYEISMTYADCPDALCVRTGKIKYAGQSIICIPNRVSVIIPSDNVDIYI